MKIRTAKDVEQLDLRIKEELGIDVSKYKNEEAVESLAELIQFPQYVGSWIIRPLFLIFLFFIAGFFVIDLVHIEYVLYAIVGSVLFTVVALTLGLLLLSWKMKGDIWGVINYTFSIMQNAITDVNDLGKKITPENRSNVLGLLFNGIIHIVTIPLVSNLLSEEMPIGGKPVSWLIKKVLTAFSDRLNFHDEAFNEIEKQEIRESSKGIELMSSGLMTMSGGLEKLLNITFNIARFPIGFIFIIASILLTLFLYLIW